MSNLNLKKMKTGIKMRVTPEQSRKIQEIVFANGGCWFVTDPARIVELHQLLKQMISFSKVRIGESITFVNEETIKKGQFIRETENPFLWINSADDNSCYLTRSNDEALFNRSEEQEIDPELFIKSRGNCGE